MSDLRIGIIGAGWPGIAHAKGFLEAGGFKIVAVADHIPERRKKIMQDFGARTEYAEATDLLKDVGVDAVSICLPNNLHAPIATEALRANKHVLLEFPPALSATEAHRLSALAEKKQKTLLYAAPRRYSPHAQAAKAAIDKGYAGDLYHARASWTRTRGTPQGTGWYTTKSLSGGGGMTDLGIHVLDLAWYLMGNPAPQSVFAATHQKFSPPSESNNVEDSAFALIKFENNKTIELSASWALNQPPQQNGSVVRLHSPTAAIEVYTPEGAILYRDFNEKGDCKKHPLKPPKIVNYPAMMRHFKQTTLNKTPPNPTLPQAETLMRILEAIYKSADQNKSISLT